MCNIDKIMSMLDWNNEIEVQNEGINLAKNVACIDAFLQPLNPDYNKNVWENCSKILREKSDDVLAPYLIRLLEWIEDLTWPGALIILDRLKVYTETEFLSFAVNESVKRALAMNNQIWLDNISKLLSNKKLLSSISQNTLTVLKEHFERN